MDIKLICVGPHRVGEMILQLQNNKIFIDHHDKIFIVTSIDVDKIKKLLIQFDIDMTNIVIISDDDIIAKYPQFSDFMRRTNHTGWWIKQQIIKLCCLDYYDYNQMIIHDPDALWIRSVDSQISDQPDMYFWHYNEPELYYRSAEAITGIARQTPYSLVCDYMKITKNDWASLKQTIESRFKKDWMTSIGQNLFPDSSGWIWFSEYELLGNWIISQRKPNLILQRRLEIKNLEDLKFLDYYDVIVNKDKKLFRLLEDSEKFVIYKSKEWIDTFPQYSPR
jgi:hypothetical protein